MGECKCPSSQSLRAPTLKLLVLCIIDSFILMEFFLERGWPLWETPFKNSFIQPLYFKPNKLCLISKLNNTQSYFNLKHLHMHTLTDICIIFHSHSLQIFLAETETKLNLCQNGSSHIYLKKEKGRNSILENIRIIFLNI